MEYITRYRFKVVDESPLQKQASWNACSYHHYAGPRAYEFSPKIMNLCFKMMNTKFEGFDVGYVLEMVKWKQ